MPEPASDDVDAPNDLETPSDVDVTAGGADAVAGTEESAEPVADASNASEPEDLLEAPAAVPPRRFGTVAAVALGVIVADQLTKLWVLRTLQDRGPIELVGSLQIVLLENTGVAFSLGSGNGLGPWITLLAIGIVVALSMGSTSRYPLGAVAAGLIAGGALGNLLDRAFRGDAGFLHGAVIDFIDVGFWPVFNLADSAVVIGAFLLVIATFRMPER